MIDFHTHLAYHKLYPDRFIEGIFTPEENNGLNKKKVASIVKLFLKDRNGTQLLKQMDEAEIEKAVVLMIDDFDYMRKHEITIEDNYKLHEKVLKLHTDRLIVFAGVHPGRGEGGMNILKKGIEEYGFKGVKLYPPFGFKINDERLDVFYAYCNSNNLPVLIHTGFALNGLENENAEPNALLNIADKYKNIKFIMAHAGYKLNNPVVSKLLMKDNVFADISGFQSILQHKDSRAVIEKIFQQQFNRRILFGSDWPITNIMKPLVFQIDLLREIHENCANKAENAFENVMKLNAERLLNS